MRMFLIALVFAAATTTTTAVLASDLSGSQLKATFVGKTLQWRTSDGARHGKTLYAPNGKATISGSNLPTGPGDEGTWRITGNKFCVTWKKIREGKEGCFTATRRQDGTFLMSNGVIATVK